MAAPLSSDLSRVDPADAWKPWLPAKGDWTRKWAAHLYRRAGFGGRPADIDRALSEGFSQTFERLIAGEADADELVEVFTEAGRHCKDMDNLRQCWLMLLLESGHPLREKLTLFWHNHFATSVAKVRDLHLMLEQNITLRNNALGKFQPFLLQMSRNPAMLIWLDSNQNVKAAPNENYARELMELFSLGVGNYTEKDIKEVARAFTGWHTDGTFPDESFVFNAREHDEGMKTVFGKTGNWNGEDIVRFCCGQAACARFLVGKLYRFLVSETPPPRELLVPLEDQFRKSDYDISALVRTMLGSRLFFSEHSFRKRVKWPVEFVVEALRTIYPGRPDLASLVEPLARMGQVLFAPPNVKGWRTGTDWLNSATLLSRNNFSESVAFGDVWMSSRVESSTSNYTPSDAPVITEEQAVEERPQPPEPEKDPATLLYAGKPKSPAELINRMGELLFGERLNAAQSSQIEQFLRAPTTSLHILLHDVPIPQPAQAPTAPSRTELGSAPRVLNRAPYPHNVSRPAIQFGFESPEFKARVREALHALMCLPDYQLN